MSLEVIVYILTALAAVVVVLTRVRLGEDSGGAGRIQVGHAAAEPAHGAGVVALLTWILFLVADDESALGGEAVGILALACWWVVVVAGLLILVRWLPSHGRHASEGTGDSWSEGPGLSILAHVGMLVGRGRLHLRLPHLGGLTGCCAGSRALAAVVGVLAAGLTTLPAATSAGSGAPAAAAEDEWSAVIGRRVIGKSVEGRKIRAYHLGEPGEVEGRADRDHARQRGRAPPHPAHAA